VYKAPRKVLSSVANLKAVSKEKNESVCCGGSLGSLSLSSVERKAVTESSLEILNENNPDEIITSCPLCLKTFSQYSRKPVKDISQIVLENIS
jgi:Fe-S oxidoreductase